MAKSVVWVGPADGKTSTPLCLEAREGSLQHASSPAIKPGMVLMYNSSRHFVANENAGTGVDQMFLVADKDKKGSRSISDRLRYYDNVIAIQPRSGEFLNVMVVRSGNSDEPLQVGTPLTLAGNAAAKKGALMKATKFSQKKPAGNSPTFSASELETEKVVAFVDEKVTVTANAKLVRVRVA